MGASRDTPKFCDLPEWRTMDVVTMQSIFQRRATKGMALA